MNKLAFIKKNHLDKNSPISPASLTISSFTCNSRSNLGSGLADTPVTSSITNETFLEDGAAPSDLDEFLRDELARAEAKGKL